MEMGFEELQFRYLLRPFWFKYPPVRKIISPITSATNLIQNIKAEE